MIDQEQNSGSKSIAAVAEVTDPSRRTESIRRVVELSGGMKWLKPGQTVVIKPALNSSGKFPFTSSPESCAELVRMCLECDASMVYVADEMGFEHTVTKHWKTGKFAGHDKDYTIKAFKKTGITDAVLKVAEEMGAQDRVHITTFREHGWRRHEFTEDELPPGGTTLHNKWVRSQLKQAEKMCGAKAFRAYIPRMFDLKLKKSVPGFWVPVLLDEVDHIINVFRLSTHVWSQYTTAIKNWVGIMRPDDRVWMHQLNYFKNHRHLANGLSEDDPIRSEPIYQEQLADLHLPHITKERLCVGDASQLIITGGPDGTDKPFYPANLVMATSDLVAAEVVSLAILRYGTLKAPDGLHGKYDPQPSGWADAVAGLIKDLRWPEQNNTFRGTDSKLCDPDFSNWDWVAVQRARELGLGVQGPDNLQLVFDDDATLFEVSEEKRNWLTEEILRPPKCVLA